MSATVSVAPEAHAIQTMEAIRESAKIKVRTIVEPLLTKYCNEQCKILSLESGVRRVVPEEISPGFEEEIIAGNTQLEPAWVKVKILIDEMVGPESREKILSIINEYVDVLEYDVTVDVRVKRFPQPISSARKVAEIKKDIEKKFRRTIEGLFNQFCPQRCLLADFNVRVDPVNLEEAQYGSSGEFVQDGDVAVKIKNISAQLLLDESLSVNERVNIVEMARLRTNMFKNVDLTAKSLKFPHPDNMITDGRGLGGYWKNGKWHKYAKNDKTRKSDKSDSTSRSTASNSNNNQESNKTENTKNNKEDNTKSENYSRTEKIERVESGDAVQELLNKYALIGLIFVVVIISLLAMMTWAVLKPKNGGPSMLSQVFSKDKRGGGSSGLSGLGKSKAKVDDKLIAMRVEIDNLITDLGKIFAENPRVAKHVFGKILTEEGIETTAQYIDIFGESIVLDLIRDPSMQTDVSDLMDFYAKNQFNLEDKDKLNLLRSLHNRTVASKMLVIGNRSSNLFDFLAEMDAIQIRELVKNESITVKAIVMTQVDTEKRAVIFNQMDEFSKMQLLTELSRIDHLPKEYIFNVSNALKRKQRDNPRLNTEALPGSDVLVSLLEKTDYDIQHKIVQELDANNVESSRNIKSKLVSLDTLSYMRDSQVLDVVLNLKHDELLCFLQRCPKRIYHTIMAKCPKDLAAELEEELQILGKQPREVYINIAKKVVNRIKVMANEGKINLISINERMFNEEGGGISADDELPDLTKAAG